MQELLLLIFLFFLLGVFLAAMIWHSRSAGISIFEPGTFFAGVGLAYSVIPLLGFLFHDLAAHSSADARLSGINPEIGDVARVGWFHFVFLSLYLTTYLMLRKTLPRLGRIHWKASATELVVLAMLYFGSLAASHFGAWYFDVPEPESYLETYLRFAELPLFARQLMGHLQGISQTFAIVLCLALISRPRYRFLVLIWLALEAFFMLEARGARTEFFVLGIVSLIGYHYLVRRFSTPFILALLSIALTGFLFTGALRDFAGDGGAKHALIRNEFMSVFINALDIYRLKAEGMTDAVGPMLYFSDLINFVPQQLVPFQKLDISRWYVETFYPAYAGSGGGLVFGVIAESLVGNGVVDLVWRSVFLGVAFAYFHARIVRSKQGLWSFAFYVWLIVLTYKVFRTTTLYPLTLFVLDFLPALLTANLLLWLALNIKRPVSLPVEPKDSNAIKAS